MSRGPGEFSRRILAVIGDESKTAYEIGLALFETPCSFSWHRPQTYRALASLVRHGLLLRERHGAVFTFRKVDTDKVSTLSADGRR